MLDIPSIIIMDLAVHIEKVVELGRECRVLIANKKTLKQMNVVKFEKFKFLEDGARISIVGRVVYYS